MSRAVPRSTSPAAAPSALARSRANPEAFAEVYANNVRRIAAFHAQRVLDAETASDLTAETFAVAYAKRKQFRGRVEPEEQAWLFSIARRLLSRYWRMGKVERKALERLGLEPPELTIADAEYIDSLAALAELKRRVQSALASLPAEQRFAIEQRIMLGRGYEEIAAEAGVGEPAVRARVSRGLKTLHRHVGHLPLEVL